MGLGIDIGLGSIIQSGTDLIKSYFPPDLTPSQAAELQKGVQQFESSITRDLIAHQEEALKSQRAIIVAEAQGESTLQRNWRPITMLVFVFIIANNYIFVPYLNMFFTEDIKPLELTTDMWELLKLGLGGYIAGRSVEKSIRHYRGNTNGSD